MAIAQTGAIYKSLEFDGESSRTYGVYITGEAVYNAPEREVEMIAIPGRDGAFALDRGRFENIEVSYPAGIFADKEEDFAEAISDFRNFLCSRSGYCRLTDEYNPGEYRLAVYKSGLEVEPTLLRAGKFDIVFECMPQRFLTSGETAVPVTSGDTLTNPTLFESSPLLEVDGYGNIQFNGYNIDIENVLLGDVVVSSAWEKAESGYVGQKTYTINFTNTSLLNVGDTITLNGVREVYQIELPQPNPQNVVVSYDERTNLSVNHTLSKPYMIFSIALDTLNILYGTASTWTAKLMGDVNMTGGGTSFLEQLTFTYSGGDSIDITIRQLSVGDSRKISIPSFVGNSTQTLTGTKYVDCEIGEAYLIHNDEIISINNAVQLESNLPKLAVGSNTITYDNTITSLDVVPRWRRI